MIKTKMLIEITSYFGLELIPAVSNIVE